MYSLMFHWGASLVRPLSKCSLLNVKCVESSKAYIKLRMTLPNLSSLWKREGDFLTPTIFDQKQKVQSGVDIISRLGTTKSFLHSYSSTQTPNPTMNLHNITTRSIWWKELPLSRIGMNEGRWGVASLRVGVEYHWQWIEEHFHMFLY